MTDDNSTIPVGHHRLGLPPRGQHVSQTSANRPQSDDELYDLEDQEAGGISRSRLRISEARSRFLPADGVDSASRVDGKRLLYRASHRRRRILQDGTQELGEFSDDDDDEGLERRIARLRREVEEAREDYNKKKSASAAPTGLAEHGDEGLETLSRVLDDLCEPAGFGAATATPGPWPAEERTGETGDPAPVHGPTYTITYAPTYQQSHTLAKVADFDRRLAVVEQALGLSWSSTLEAGHDGLPRAVLPTLDSMEKQISTLSQASTAHLDAISRRVRALAAEREKLNDAREKAKALGEELGKHAPPPAGADAEHEAKINALYGILPTIEGLMPMLAPLLDRLRSLRAIHADAATASQTLEHLEAQQADLAEEMKLWRDGLEKMEHAVSKGCATVKDNAAVMEGWVKGLEGRMAKLG